MHRSWLNNKTYTALLNFPNFFNPVVYFNFYFVLVAILQNLRFVITLAFRLRNLSSCINIQAWACKFLQGNFLHLLSKDPQKSNDQHNSQNIPSYLVLLHTE